MSTTTIRTARPEEWRQAKALRLEMLADAPLSFEEIHDELAAWSDERWQTRLRSHLADDSILVVATGEDGRWIGQAAGRVYGHYDPPRAYVLGVYVTPDNRGEGLSAALISAVADWAASKGLEQLHLDVYEHATAARVSYLRQGFVETGETSPNVHNTDEVEVEMVLSLRSLELVERP